MYSLIRGSRPSLAPSSRKIGSRNTRPVPETRVTMIALSSRLSVVRRCTLWWSPLPMTRERTAATPIPSPWARAPITIITGKVKLIAARGSPPSLEMKKVSTRLKTSMDRAPSIMGGVNRRKWWRIFPSVREEWFFIEKVSLGRPVPAPGPEVLGLEFIIFHTKRNVAGRIPAFLWRVSGTAACPSRA